METETKVKKKTISKSVNEMSKEMLQATLKKKKECNAKALEIVEKLCETHVDEEWFLDNLQYINQTHFGDATVERAITKICGYPLCTQILEKVPAQQYHISTRYNKVFDITERKNFCSSCCYKSAAHVKKQLFTSPLWFRDQETIPKYTLLKTSKSSLGEEVVFLPDKIKPEQMDLKKRNGAKAKVDKVDKLKEKRFNLTIQEVDNKKENLNDINIKNAENPTIQNVADNGKRNLIEGGFKNLGKNSNCQKEIQKNEDLERLQETRRGSDDIWKDENNSGSAKNRRRTPANEPTDVISKIEKSIIEWFSVDTFFYLYDEEKMKELLSDEASRIKEVLNSKLSIAGQGEKIDRMIKLYGLLDSNYFSNDTKMNLKPLPDYSVLREEGKSLEIKVRAFYQGQLEVKSNDKSDEKNEEKKEENESDASFIYMPLVDAHAQTALRRKIVLDKLNKLLPDIIRVFSTDYIVQMNEVRNLVATFSLSSTNISFKPAEWYLLGIFIIKLLSIKDKCLESILNEESSQNQISLILMSYGLQKSYLGSLIDRINDSSTLMKKVNEINR